MFKNIIDISAGDFDHLTISPDEHTIVEAASYGAYANCTVDDRFAPVEIRASFLRHLILGLPAKDGLPWKVAAGGVKVCGAKIIGNLNLRDGRLPSGEPLPPLLLEFCDFSEAIVLDEAHFRRLSFCGSSITSISAQGCVVDGQLQLSDLKPAVREGTSPSSFVDLRRSRVGSGLEIMSSYLISPQTDGRYDRYAFDLTEARVTGDINGRFLIAEGGVSFADGNFANSILLNPVRLIRQDETCLNAQSVIVGGGFCLESYEETKTIIKGGLDFYDAKIGSNFTANGAILENPNGNALQAIGANIGGHFFIDRKIEIHGNLSLQALTVKGVFSAIGATLHGSSNSKLSQVSLNLESSNIGGELLLEDVNCEGAVCLDGSKIDGILKILNTTIHAANNNPTKTNSNKENTENFTAIRSYNMIASKDCFLNGLSTNGDITFWGGSVGQTFSVGSAAGCSPKWRLRDFTVGQLDDLDGSGWGKNSDVDADGFKYNSLSVYSKDELWNNRKSWLRKLKNLGGNIVPQPYEHLAKILSAMGYVDDSRRAITYLNWRRIIHFRRISWSRPLEFVTACIFSPIIFIANILFGFGFAFGYSPVRAAATFLIFIGLGTAAVDFANSNGLMALNTTAVSTLVVGKGANERMVIPRGEKTDLDIVPCGENITPLWYAVDTFVPLIDLGQAKACVSQNVGNRSNPVVFGLEWHVYDSWFLRSLVSIYALLGAIITSLTVLTFSGVLRRNLQD